MQNKFDTETQMYFDSLPEFVRQTIIMSEPKITCKSDLEKIAEKLIREGE